MRLHKLIYQMIFITLVLFSLSGCSNPAESPTTLDAAPNQDLKLVTAIVVRHAERSALPPGDPLLSTAGKARSNALVNAAREAEAAAIYSSPYIRNLQTASPLAAYLGLPVLEVDADDVEALVDKVMSEHTGEVVLIVEHSNTVPEIIEKFGGDPIPLIAKNDYDDLFIISVYGSGSANVVHMNYGEPTDLE